MGEVAEMFRSIWTGERMRPIEKDNSDMPEFDFSNVPTHQLSHETRARATQVNEVTGALWDAVPLAWGGSIAIMIGPVFFVFNLWLGILATIAGATLSYLAARPWFDAHANCTKYTREMRARTAELERRNRARAAP